ETALTSYQEILARAPADPVARSSVARCELLLRTRGADEAAVRRDAEARPDDVATQLVAADLEMVLGQVDEAFARLVGLVRRTADADRDAARARLLTLFDVLDPDDALL